MDQQRHKRHHNHHYRSETINHEADMGRILTHLEKGIEILIKRCSSLSNELVKRPTRQRATDSNTQKGHTMRPLAADLAPNNPAIMLPNSGARTTAISIFLERVISICGSALQSIDFGHIDRVAGTEQSDQDREANGSLCSSNGQNENTNNWPAVSPS